MRNTAKEVAIKTYIDRDYLPYYVFLQQQRDSILREKVPEILDLMNEYDGSK